MVVGAALAAASVVGVASADDISNKLDGTIDAPAEIMPLTVGGTNGTTTLYVQPRNADSDNGCNFGDDEKLVLDLHSSTPAVATVNATATFTGPGCGDTPTVTVTPLSEGSTTITATVQSNNTGGSFNLDPATFVVNVTKPTPTNTPPTVTITGVEAAHDYEVGSEPSPVCDVADTEDGNSSFPATVTGTLAHGLGTLTADCSYTDGGDVTVSTSMTYNIVDTHDPSIHFDGFNPVANSFGWNKTDVDAAWTCSDDGSGVQHTTTSHQFTASDSFEATCVDWAGNTATDTQSVKIDKDAPLVSLVGGPDAGGSYYYGFVPAAPTCNASDALSGLNGACSVNGYSNGFGSQTVTANAADKAGNANSDSHSYTVLAWTLKGFYQPVDMGGVLNTIKGGSTVPLKFEIFAGATELIDTTSVKSLTSAKIGCDSSIQSDDIEFTAMGGTSLRYDATAGQFVYNWQTPKLPGQCYRVTMTTQDGSTLAAQFKLK